MPSALVAHEQAISRIFSNDYVFRIPSYQRPYAWTTEQARDLFDDLVGFMKGGPAEVQDMPPYFLGSIVLIKAEHLPNADVVDGQQRLTTLTLLLSAIRANVPSGGGEDITRLLYEKGSQILGTKDRFRLSLRPRDQEFFQKFVQRDDGFAQLLALNDQSSDSRKNIRENARLFDARLKAMQENERLSLAQFIVTRCFLVAVATPDLDSAYRIFSVLNSRGLDLSPTDILKAEILGRIKESVRDAYTQKWEDMEEDLGRDEFGELFSHIRMVYRKAKPQGTVLKEFRDHVLNERTSEALVDGILIPMADIYQELIDAEYSSTERAKAVNESLRWLNRLEFKDWMPPALAFAVRHRGKPAAMELFFGYLERLAYSMMIRKIGINDRIERFSRLTGEVETNADLQCSSSALQLSPGEQFATYKQLNGPLYDDLSARARATVLLRLDALLSGGGATYDYETTTVEHVLPQTPQAGSKWLDWFPDPVVRGSVVHSLGNLALLTRKKNSAASNYEFDKKKIAYFAREGISPFVLTTQVLHALEWTLPVVAARQADLMTKLEDHWRLKDRKDPLADLGIQVLSAVGPARYDAEGFTRAPEIDPDGNASAVQIFWAEFLADFRCDDLEQPIPRPARLGYICFMLPAKNGSSWLTVYRRIRHGEVGVTLSSHRNTVGDYANQSIVNDWNAVKHHLRGTAKVIEENGRFFVRDSRIFGALDRPEVRKEAFAWLAERVNTFVNVIRPRVRSAAAEFQSSAEQRTIP
jgi:hypothetical protein